MKAEVTLIIDTGDTPLTIDDIRAHFFEMSQSLYEICDENEIGHTLHDMSVTVKETT